MRSSGKLLRIGEVSMVIVDDGASCHLRRMYVFEGYVYVHVLRMSLLIM